MAFESVSISVTTIVQQQNRVIINFSNGTAMEFTGTWTDFVSSVDSYFRGWGPEVAAMIGLARWINRNPGGANPQQLAGRTVTLNVGAANTANVLSVT